MRAIALYGIGVALLLGTSFANARVARRPAVDGVELMYFPSGDLVSAASLGFDTLAADFAFVRAAQYYGEHRLTDREFPWAAHLFNVIYELDPTFVTPYLLGSLILAEDNGDVPAALEYLDKGQAANPDNWELAFESGFIRMVHGKDQAAAAPWFVKSMQLPGAPPYVRNFAAYCNMNAGDEALGLLLWKQVAETTDNPALREAAERYISELEGETDAG